MLLHWVPAIISVETQRRTDYGKIHPLREAFQEEKAKNQSSQTADLGRTESRYQKARKQQGIQQKEDAGLEEGTSKSCVLLIIPLHCSAWICSKLCSHKGSR